MIRLLLLTALVSDVPAPWPQWGSPTRDFHVPGAKLAASWPREGPRRVWSREAGDGFSAILADGRRLTPEGMTVHSEAQILTKLAWTVPTGRQPALRARPQDDRRLRSRTLSRPGRGSRPPRPG
jgi:hypothetical protein